MIHVTCACAFFKREIEVNDEIPLARVLQKVKQNGCASACGFQIRNRNVGEEHLPEPISRFSPDGSVLIRKFCDPEPFVGEDGVADNGFQTYHCVNNTYQK